MIRSAKQRAALRKAQLASARKRKGHSVKTKRRIKTAKRIGKSFAKGAAAGALMVGSMNASTSLAAGRGARYAAGSGMAGLKAGAKFGVGVVAVAHGVRAVKKRRKKRK